MVLKIKKHKAIILLGKVMMPWLFLLLAVQVTLSDGRSSINDEELGLLFNQLLEIQSPSEADEITLKIWEIWTNDAETEFGQSTMLEGVSLMNRNSLVAAEKLFSELIRVSPDYIEAWNKRATVRYMMGQLENSLNDVYVVLSKEPKHFGAMSGLGLIMIQREDFEGALSAYKKLIAIHPFSKDALSLVPILEQRVLGKSI
jgi:tetratricopeptide (TPR) repeat protein